MALTSRCWTSSRGSNAGSSFRCRAGSDRDAPQRRHVPPRSVDELDLDSPAHHLPQRLRVPVGEAHAAVRFGLADVLRLRGAVDAEAVAEIDPGVADRIVGAGGDVEGLFRLHSFELWLGWGVV